MATIILSAVGAAVGSSIGGSVLGLSTAAVGRFAGATLGRLIDQRLLGQGSDVVESGRVDRFRLTGAGEGDPVARLYGRMRLPGQVIWASQFEEIVTVSGGGKGGPRAPETRSHAYRVSLAVALCEGGISGIGRIWADGVEIAQDTLGLRVYHGTEDQLPDPKIEAVEGAGRAPAYRGTAYVVFEDLALAPFGNRVPQFAIETIRPAPADEPVGAFSPARAVRAVAMLPGCGEYALATTPVSFDEGHGRVRMANVHTASGKSDFTTALDQMDASLVACEGVSLVVSWFGNDLRCGACEVRPRVEQTLADGRGMPWQVAGLSRAAAGEVGRDGDDRPVYGGTPADASVIEAIRELNARGKRVMFYPFVLMEQMAGNGLPDPWSAAGNQPVLPWRGRITCSVAPGREDSPDGTATAAEEVAAFFGTAAAADFSHEDGVGYTGPAEWRFRRFILHCAALCAAAGGVDAFCIGSEMRGLTQVRGPGNSFPAVAALRDLAAEVRALLPDAKIGYAADWSEYFGHHPQDGSGDVFFHLDPLWADDTIDFVGIDNYMPLSDWREGDDHADTAWGSVYDPDYLASNVEGGEGYAWYYHSPEAEAAQIRTPIEDGAHGEDWVFRYKDLRNWWANAHHDRIGGVRQAVATEWMPGMKPVWFTELGCPAVDKGTNQPNVFHDPKSSESFLPRHSTGRRDEVIQARYLEVMHRYWSDPAHNPVSPVYGGRMLDLDRMHVWAWDARPFPAFPSTEEAWSDGANYRVGHWITGRASGRGLDSLVSEICREAGLEDVDVSDLHGHVSGYVVEEVGAARGALQPLMLRHGFDAVERDGALRFVMRDGRADADLGEGDLAVTDELEGRIEETRAGQAEMAGRVRLRFVQADAEFAVVAEEAVMPDEASRGVATSEMALAMTRGEGRQVLERWLTEARVARDTVRLALPPSRRDLGAGDVLRLPVADGAGLFRVDRVEQAAHQIVEAVRIEPETYRPVDMAEDEVALSRFVPPVPVLPVFMDLPLITGEEVPHAPHVAVTAKPWPGAVAVYAADEDAGYRLNTEITRRATVGVTESALAAGPVGLVDRGEGLSVRLTSGALASVSDRALLGGANLAAIGDGTPGNWELFQFRDAVMTGPDTWLLSQRLRGQLGSDALMPALWPVGSRFVLLDRAPEQIGLTLGQRRLARHYRYGPALRPVDDPAYGHAVLAFDGNGLRPYAPVHLRGAWTGGDLSVGWIRRTRIGGDGWDGVEVPLAEEAELYLIRVMQAGGLLREAQTGAPGWVYTAAMQAADGLTPGLFEVQIAQVSALYGAGPFRVLSLSA